MRDKRTVAGLVVAVVTALIVWWGQADDGQSSDADRATGDLASVGVAELPAEGRETLELIDSGGPFPHEKDGSTFHNFEQILPEEADGYYREYTVDTPGSDDRGARRIVAGKNSELYYTEDHYSSFWRINR